jgi:dTMP kinase
MRSTSRSILSGFVVLEGIDGAGTTTQLHRLEARLASRSIPHWTSFEPSDLPTGLFVRRVLSGEVSVTPATLARLYAADRNEHLNGKGGALERIGRGELVVFDRYLFSSLAYQGMSCGRGLPEALNAEYPLPELLLYFDLDVDVAMSRVARRNSRDIFETHEIQRRVRIAYEETLATFAESGMIIQRIDAGASLGEVSRQVDEAMDRVTARLHGG